LVRSEKKSARAGEAPRGRENPFEGSIRRNGFGPELPSQGAANHVRKIGQQGHAPSGLPGIRPAGIACWLGKSGITAKGFLQRPMF